MAQQDALGRALTAMGVATSRPTAFLIVISFTLAWVIIQPETFDWHGVATIATWTMTLFIQRAAHRDTQALHAKIDELLRNHPEARTELEHIDEDEPEDIERHRAREQS